MTRLKQPAVEAVSGGREAGSSGAAGSGAATTGAATSVKVNKNKHHCAVDSRLTLVKDVNNDESLAAV